MPNIEIHGLAGVSLNGTTDDIVNLLRPAPFAEDVVISLINDNVINLGGNNRPYLRVVGTDATETQQVVDLLKPLKVDIEVLLLHAFVPAQ